MPFTREALPAEQWPRADRFAWDAASAGDDPLKEQGPAAHWRDKTLQTVLTRYGLWLAWLHESGRLDPAVEPIARATSDNLAAYLQRLRDSKLAPFTIVGRFRDLREAIRVMQPGVDLGTIEHLLSRLKAVAMPTRRKRLTVLSPVILLDAAIAKLKRLRGDQERHANRRTAERFRDALIVAFLATRPLRLANLASLRLGESITRQHDMFWCSFADSQTKDGRLLEFPVPQVLTPWLDQYLEIHRPLLLRSATNDRLWISIRSTPMQDNSIYCRVVHTTFRLVGRRLNPHLFRDCVATFIAEHAPDEIRIVAQILGHSSLATAEDHYNQAGMLSAQARYLEALERVRADCNDLSRLTCVPILDAD